MSELITVKNIGPLFEPIRQRLAALERPAQDLTPLIARIDVLELLNQRHIRQLETHAPGLLRQVAQANAQSEILIKRLEVALAEHEAWRQRVQILDRDLMGRLRWLLFGR